MFSKKQIRQYKTTLSDLGYQLINKQSPYTTLNLRDIFQNKIWESGWCGITKRLKVQVFEIYIDGANHRIVCVNIDNGNPVANCEFYIKKYNGEEL